jgi:adenosine/AMP kinase
MEIKSIAIRPPEGVNLILGQSHFIRTVEDIAEIVATTVPQGKYGLAFNESSGPCLIRVEANEPTLKEMAIAHARAIGAGHVFVLCLRDCYPINLLNGIKQCPEVCSIFCATANPIEVIVAESSQGRGVLGVIDGLRPNGVETEQDVTERRRFLRKIGYKL